MTKAFCPGDLVFEKGSPWIKNNQIGLVIYVTTAEGRAHALSSPGTVAYVLFTDRGIRGPYLPGQLAMASEA